VSRFPPDAGDPEDLFQVGCLGLLQAAERFDETVGTRFSTYAVPLVLGAIRGYLRATGAVKVGRTLREKASRVQAARERLQADLGREPILEELASEVGLSREEVVEAEEAMQPVASLSEPVLDDGSLSLADRVGHASFADEKVESIALRQALDRLDPIERAVVEMRFFGEMRQVEIAGRLGISQPQVCKIEQRALRRLRQELG